VAALLSPDGKTFAAIDRYGEYNLIPLAGGEAKPIDGLVPGDQLLQWSSDGRALYVRAGGDMELEIYRLDLSSGRREVWKDLKPPDPVALIGIPTDPGNVRITPDGKHYVYTYWTYSNQLFTVAVAKGHRPDSSQGSIATSGPLSRQRSDRKPFF
jgi:WD40 repeat protein